ncbi:MAG TPA: prepilin-type N-terminal cleavage/methylation domain-containing protein [Candidatus Saccharimonadales bacterium]|nr:prepilin-type N-terminal cleavage/methylation domain-containing protein [Candidatus Saccharimonadales bacterium]
MLDRSTRHQYGFTLPELLVVMVVIAVVITTMFTFLTAGLKRYLGLQQQASAFGTLASETQRIATVLRGLTDISSVGSNDLTVYAYFYPSDTYVSLVRYYKNTAKTQLLADVTPMTANPPIGSPLTAQKKTYVIIPNLYSATSTAVFTYLDSSNSPLTLPVGDEHTIKGIQITLVSPADPVVSASTTTMTLDVSLRNRKTNL